MYNYCWFSSIMLGQAKNNMILNDKVMARKYLTLKEGLCNGFQFILIKQ